MIIPQNIHISKHQVVHLKYTQFLFVYDTSLSKAEENKCLLIPWGWSGGEMKYFGATNWNGKWGIESREDFPRIGDF